MTIKTLTALPNYRLKLEFSDGTQGMVDLSGKVGTGVFAAWRDPEAFARVRVGPDGQAEWPDEIELCPDTLYLEATGRLPRDVEDRKMREVGKLRTSTLVRFGRNQRRAFAVAPRAGEQPGVRRFPSWNEFEQWQMTQRQVG